MREEFSSEKFSKKGKSETVAKNIRVRFDDDVFAMD